MLIRFRSFNSIGLLGKVISQIVCRIENSIRKQSARDSRIANWKSAAEIQVDRCLSFSCSQDRESSSLESQDRIRFEFQVCGPLWVSWSISFFFTINYFCLLFFQIFSFFVCWLLQNSRYITESFDKWMRSVDSSILNSINSHSFISIHRRKAHRSREMCENAANFK